MAPASVQLDSSRPGDASWKCPAASASAVLRCEPGGVVTRLIDDSGLLREWRDPLDALAWLESDLRDRAAGPTVRWVGFLSYDLGRWFEEVPQHAIGDLNLPLFEFARIEKTNSVIATNPFGAVGARNDLRSTFTRNQYMAAVERAIEYISAGDIFQVNLSQRFSLPAQDCPRGVYERLIEASPAHYGGLLDFGDFALICNSPELFLRVSIDPRTHTRTVTTRPIKGTRARRPGMEAELRQSIKDAAELNMIVDLERNDLGRVCRIGTVKVTQPRTVETHPTVLHGVASVEGVLRDGISFVDLLRATFPGGSITGAPKIRAMQIIDELEPVRRGPYCGAIGYLASDGTIEFNVAIRTMIAYDGHIHIHVGGGVVADSHPSAEYEETLVKAQAMFAALGLSMSQAKARIKS